MAGTGTNDLVVDASVLVKVVIPEDYSPVVERLVERVPGEDPKRLLVPEVLYLEVANALWKQVVRGHRLPAIAKRSMERMELLDLTVVSNRELAPAALRIALDRGISAYDAAYVALSDREKVPLVTADRRLIDRLRGTRHRVRWLGEFA